MPTLASCLYRARERDSAACPAHKELRSSWTTTIYDGEQTMAVRLYQSSVCVQIWRKEESEHGKEQTKYMTQSIKMDLFSGSVEPI